MGLKISKIIGIIIQCNPSFMESAQITGGIFPIITVRKPNGIVCIISSIQQCNRVKIFT